MAVEEGIDDYTQDGTVDLKGNPVRRSKRGGWTACSFVVVYEVFERMAYYGISSNLVLYLTRKLHQGTVKSANNVTNWVGTIWITPILGAYVADAHLGRYWTFVFASLIYVTVKETKQMLRMIPILIATFVPSTMIAQIKTLFIKQGTTLDRHIGNFKIPPASLAGFVTISMLVCVVLYDRFFGPVIRKWTNNPRGITLLQRMGIGLVLHFVIMAVASLTERYRLNVAKQHGLVENGGQLPLTIFILLPQFVLMGTADAFLEVAKLEFFYDQAPESMKSLGTSYSSTSLGIGNFLSSFLLSTVSDITQRDGHEGWILNNLNKSHLDYYYAFFAVLNFLNFIFFMAMIRFYVYKAEVSDSMHVLTEELKVMRLKASNQEAAKGIA
ncbi:hypothetical protein GOBAR_AA28696 [Gossypium barbadense]|uniref:Uncharacterized protein n=1 Tax=Gossypium barbadense TaxID=3634 RepID=A0A2P5WLN3_GOSBA|nr:hypothetical protein GOBAR_AA28696 [Gossypium barbadense]